MGRNQRAAWVGTPEEEGKSTPESQGLRELHIMLKRDAEKKLLDGARRIAGASRR
jgi:hypothetical protein